MKKLALILIVFVFAGCKYVVPFIEDNNIFDDWNEYKAECYNDSVMVIKNLNSGELKGGEIIFDKDTVYAHRSAVWDEFLNQKR